MSDQLPNVPVSSSPVTIQPEPFYTSWLKAVTRPNRQTYIEIANQPNAGTATGLLWVLITGLLEFFVTFAVSGVSQQEVQRLLGGAQQLPASAGSRVFEVLCGAPVAAVLAAGGFALSVGIVHLVARAFGGKATYGQLLFVFAAMFAPLALVSTFVVLLEAIPFVGGIVSLCFVPVSFLLLLYIIAIEVIATSAVHAIGMGSAAVSVIVFPIVVGLCAACAVIASLMVLGPTIGNVFSTINSSLQGVP